MNELRKLLKKLKSYQAMHSKFKKAFLEDGTISPVEQQKLDALEKQINIILEYIDALKSPNAKLDKLYEIVIESNKKVTTKPDIFNKKQYQDALQQFSAAYNEAPAGLKKLWKKAVAKSKEDFKIAKQKLAEATATQEAASQLEQQACASIYCIIRGKDTNGKDWYRIDYVGANYREGYVEQPKEGRLNDIPLLVRYYTYENGSYNFVKDSSKLETAQDKQLMDAFLKSNKLSYEQYKQLDRDYEYHPKNAGVSGSGAWYINLSNLTTEKHTEVTIEVPDWEDFGFQNLYDQHVRDCEAGTLSKSDSQALKQQMQQSIVQQKENLKTLEQFHQHQNDSNANTTELIAIWQDKIRTFEQEVKELKDECFKAHKHNPPCSDFDTPYEEHERLCREEKLTNILSKKLKAEMQNCIDDNTKLIKQKEASIATYKKNPSWKSSTKIKDEIKKLEDEINKTTKEVKENEDKLSKLPDECLTGEKIEDITLALKFKEKRKSFEGDASGVLNPILKKLLENPKNIVSLRPNTKYSRGVDIPDLWGALADADTSDELVQLRGQTIRDWFEKRGVKSKQIIIIIDSGNFNTSIDVTGNLKIYE